MGLEGYNPQEAPLWSILLVQGVWHLAGLQRLARIMHKFSTASPKSLVLTVLRDPQAGAPGLLSVPYSTLAGASVTRLVRSALSALRDENLCIIRA